MCKSTNIYSPNPIGQVFKIPPFSAQKSHSEGGRGSFLKYFLGGILLYLLLRSACKIPEPYNKPFWEKLGETNPSGRKINK
jgi:hypothetical protein